MSEAIAVTKPEKNAAPAYVDRGTPETRRQQKQRGPGTMDSLFSKGKICLYMQRAADEIAKVFYYQTAAVFSKTMRYGPREDKGYSEKDPKWFKDAFVKRYKPWAGRNEMYVSICIAVLVDGHTGRELDAWYHWRKGTAVNLLVSGLRDYALAAGWVDHNTAEDWRRDRERAA